MITKCLAAFTQPDMPCMPPYVNVSYHPEVDKVRVIVRNDDGVDASITLSRLQWLAFLRDLNNQTAAELIRKK